MGALRVLRAPILRALLAALVLTRPWASAAEEPRPVPSPAELAPVPSPAELAQAEKLIKELFQADYARKTPAERKLLARKLLDRGKETSDRACRYVLFRDAREMAAGADDLKTGLEAIREMAASFRVKPREVRFAFLTSLSSRPAASPSAARGLAGAWLELGEESLAADEYPEAARAAAQAARASRDSKDFLFQEAVEARAEFLKELEAEFLKVKPAAEKLKGQPDEAAANLTVGRFLCFMREDWERGVGLLAKGSSPALQVLAVKELERPAASSDQLALGDGWWDLAAKETGAARRAIQGRASHWYRKALPTLPEPAREERARRIAEAEEAAREGRTTVPPPPAGEIIAGPLLGGLVLKSAAVLSASDKPYTINGLLTVSPAASHPLLITIRPRVEVVGGTIDLQRVGHLVIEGTPERPAVLRRVRILQDLDAHMTARHAIFEKCTFAKGGRWFLEYSSRWQFESCLLYQCRFPALYDVNYGFQLKNCTFASMTFPEIHHRASAEATFDVMQRLRGGWNRIEDCTFFGCTVPPSIVWCAVRSNFLQTKFIQGNVFNSETPTEALIYVAEPAGEAPHKVLEGQPPRRAPIKVRYEEKPFPCFRFPGSLPLPELRGNARFQKWYGVKKR